MPRIIIMHDNGTEEIQDYCVVCFPTVDEIENYCRERGDVQWVQHNPAMGRRDRYGRRLAYCFNEGCRKLLSARDGSDNPFTTIIPINGRLNYAAG